MAREQKTDFMNTSSRATILELVCAKLVCKLEVNGFNNFTGPLNILETMLEEGMHRIAGGID